MGLRKQPMEEVNQLGIRNLPVNFKTFELLHQREIKPSHHRRHQEVIIHF